MREDFALFRMLFQSSNLQKPGYKKKQQKEIDALRRKRKRAIIQQDIARQKKERAKAKQRAKRNEE